MQLPFAIDNYRTFNLMDIFQWVQVNNPKQIEMTDKQYSRYSGLCRTNKRDFNGVPIVFTEAPLK